MKTTMNIPEELLELAMRESGAKNRTQTVQLALEALIREVKVKRLVDSAGTFDFGTLEDVEATRNAR